jgi:hypothetical protein
VPCAGPSIEVDVLSIFRGFAFAWQAIMIAIVSRPAPPDWLKVPETTSRHASAPKPPHACSLSCSRHKIATQRAVAPNRNRRPGRLPSSAHALIIALALHLAGAVGDFKMAEHVSSILRLMRQELTAERQRQEAGRIDMEMRMAGAQLALKQSRALLLAPAGRPTPEASPSRSRAYVDSEPIGRTGRLLQLRPQLSQPRKLAEGDAASGSGRVRL